MDILDEINLDDDNSFDEDDPETNIYVRLLAWCNKLKKLKSLRKRKQRINACNVAS